MASEEFESLSFADYIEDLKETEMRNYEVINSSSALVGEKISISLKGTELLLANDEVCASDLYVLAQIKKFGLNGIFNGIRTLKVKFVKVCFKNSRLTSLEPPLSVVQEGFLLSMDQYQLSVKGSTGGKPVIHFHPNGKLDHISNVKNDFILKMFYECGNERSPERRNGCTGPYRDNDTKISDPGPISFSKVDEVPVGIKFPTSSR